MVINATKVVMVFQGTIKTYLRLNGAESAFPGQGSGAGAWFTRTTSWSPSRPGGGNWTWADIANLQVVPGLSTVTSFNTTYPGKLTQIYVQVQYINDTNMSNITLSSITLRPNCPGDYNNIESPATDPTTHWTLVDDITADGDATYVWTNSATEQKDAYNLENPPGM